MSSPVRQRARNSSKCFKGVGYKTTVLRAHVCGKMDVTLSNDNCWPVLAFLSRKNNLVKSFVGIKMLSELVKLFNMSPGLMLILVWYTIMKPSFQTHIVRPPEIKWDSGTVPIRKEMWVSEAVKSKVGLWTNRTLHHGWFFRSYNGCGRQSANSAWDNPEEEK